MSKGNYQIPFDKDGNQQTYPESWYVGKYPDHKAAGPDWRDNEPFADTLTYTGYSRGRSAANIEFTRTDGTSVSFFMTDFHDVAPLMELGKLSGKFQFVKRGQNYGCQMIKEAT
ncbi:hypothetical protein CBM2637_A150014 [Cupriavidus taiwanensis]|uniref:hypothetical protein n=1 Tax=Cupriavidus taiwanensis TaxID=164546 RepID=UPI000E16F0D2|nr:hypothetical protein [Cupriavidus taiwanensis]SPA24561.1 hypothetical protein CBM2637_A150014 [Cupriavidus taiwanensis]